MAAEKKVGRRYVVGAAKKKESGMGDVKAAVGRGRGKRLSPEQRTAIATEPMGATLAELAAKYDTSINTISRYRGPEGARAGRADVASRATTGRRAGVGGGKAATGGKLAAGGKLATGGMKFTVEGEYIVLRIPKGSIMREVLSGLMD